MTSLVACAAGFCAWRALKQGGTWAQDRVLLEPSDMPDIGTDPAIVLYCERGKVESPQGPLLGGSGMQMRIETWIVGNTPDGLSVGVSSAIPFAIFWRQCVRALFEGERDSWSDLFRIFAGPLMSAETYFDLYAPKEGAAIAIRSQELRFGDGIGEPEFGKPPSGVWARWLAKLRAENAEFAAYADVIEAAIIGAPTIEWRSDLAALGVPTSDAKTMRLDFPDYPGVGGDPGTLERDVPVASAKPPVIP